MPPLPEGRSAAARASEGLGPAAAGTLEPSLDADTADQGWSYLLRVGVVWIAVSCLTVFIAHLTGVRLPPLRFLAPYVTWPLLTPLVAALVRRFPLGSRRGVLLHLALALGVMMLHGLVFRLFLLSLGRGFPPPPTDLADWVATLTVDLVLYFSTALPMAASLALRRARRADLARARAEAAAAARELDVTLGQLGPRQLDGLLGRVRQTIEESPATAEAAVAALATYLRTGIAAVEEARWTLERELGAAAAYLGLEAACGRAGVELEVDTVPDGRPVAQWSLVAAITSLVESVEGPLRLRLRGEGERCSVEALDPATRRVLATVLVPP